MANTQKWMGFTGEIQEKFQVSEKQWKVVNKSVMQPTKEAQAMVSRAKFLETKQGFKVLISIPISATEEMNLWFNPDFKLLKEANHGDELEIKSLKFFLLTNSEWDAEYEIGKQTLAYLDNFSAAFKKAVLKLAQSQPVKLFVTAEVASC